MGTPVPRNRQRPRLAYRGVAELGVAGGVAFWAANFATSLSPIAAQYRVALSISYTPMLLESLIGGAIIGCCVSYFLLRFFDRIRIESPVLKSVILSCVALVIIEALFTLFDFSYPLVDLLMGVGLNIPRFLTMGLASAISSIG